MKDFTQRFSKKQILQMKAEIAALRSGRTTEYPDGIGPKKTQLAAYLREHPGVSNKNYIARKLEMDVGTVRKYYDEVRAELAEQPTASQQMVC